MGFNEIYDEHRQQVEAIEGDVKHCEKQIRAYIEAQAPLVREAILQSDGKVKEESGVNDFDNRDGWKFKWSFWSGKGHYNATFPSENSRPLTGYFSWSRSAPNKISVSGPDGLNRTESLDAFIESNLPSHMEFVLREVFSNERGKMFTFAS